MSLPRGTIVVVLACGLFSCGGSVTKKGGEAAAGGMSAAGGESTTGGSKAAMAGAATMEPLDDDTGSYPPLPPGSGGFFWRGGLGNWFITSSSGPVRDAESRDEEGRKVWPARGEPDANVDLWAQLNHPAGTGLDLSAYSGIVFDARLSDAGGGVAVGFNADGDFKATEAWLPEQHLNASDHWETRELAFDSAGADAANISSIDFVVSGRAAPFELAISHLALSCKSRCP